MARVVYHGELRTLTKCPEELITAKNMKEILRQISVLHGADAAVAARRSLMTVDGCRVSVQDMRKLPLSESSQVCFFPLCIGG